MVRPSTWTTTWLLGDKREVLVTDAPHDAAAVAEAVGNRRAVALA